MRPARSVLLLCLFLSARAVDLLVLTEMLGGTAELGLISSFGVDAAGEMYIVSYSRGRILKIVP